MNQPQERIFGDSKKPISMQLLLFLDVVSVQSSNNNNYDAYYCYPVWKCNERRSLQEDAEDN